MTIVIWPEAFCTKTLEQALLPVVLFGWLAATPLQGAESSSSSSPPVASAGQSLSLELSPDQGSAQRVAFDEFGNIWVATRHTLYQIQSGKLTELETRRHETLELAPGDSVHAWLQLKKYRQFDVELVDTQTRTARAHLRHDRLGFDGLILGRKGQLIVTTTPLDDWEGGGGRVEYNFWSPEGNLVACATVPKRSISIIDPNGTTLLLLGDSKASSFSAQGQYLWRYPGRYRKGAISQDGAVALLNPRADIRKVHLLNHGKRTKVVELPSPVHHLALAADGSRGAIAIDRGRVFLIDTTSGALTEVTLPLDGLHFVTDVRFLDSTTITLGAILAAEKKPDKNGRFSFPKASVMAFTVGGELLFRQDISLEQPAQYAPSIDVAYGTRHFAARAGHNILIVTLSENTSALSRLNSARHLAVRPVRALSPKHRSHSRGPLYIRHMESESRKLKRERPPAPRSLHGWPIKPADQAHALGNTLGQFQLYSTSGVNQHAGIDILAIPKNDSGDPASLVVVTVGGIILCTPGNSLTESCTIEGDDGISYLYLHLADILANAMIKSNSGLRVEKGTDIAYVVEFPGGGGPQFNHLHYELTKGDKNINPLRDISPLADDVEPTIDDVGFAKVEGDEWDQFSVISDGFGPPCTVVSGNVDIIAKVSDLDNAAVCKLGIYRIRWRACPAGMLNCAVEWQPTFEFGEMPAVWFNPGNAWSKAQFSSMENQWGDWESKWDYCTKTVFMIPTNWKNNEPNVVGTWATATNGLYLIEIEATDFANNVTLKNDFACVNN